MEPWLIAIADYLLAQSWQIAVLTIVVALASFGLRNRSAHVRYLLWLIVLAKALVPPLYSIPVAVLPRQEPPAYVGVPPIAETMVAEPKVPEAAGTEVLHPAGGQSQAASSLAVLMSPARRDARAWLVVGWLVGVGALSFYYLLNALRTQIWLQKHRKALSSESACAIESFFAAHGVHRMPRVWLLDRTSQPFVWGLVRGSIYLPARLWHGHSLGSAQDRPGRDCFHGLEARATFQTSLLGHELCHVIRLDAMVNSLQVVAQTVFWFHPCLWWANAKIRAEREKCCDEMTIARLNARPEEYGEAIVETLAAKYEQARPVPSLAVAGQVKNIEERINTMLKPGKKFYKRPSLVALTVAPLFALFAVPTTLVLTARAQTEAVVGQDSKPAKPLRQAAADGDIEQVKILLAKGADVNEKGRRGETALHRACEKGRSEVARLLIDKGADVNAMVDSGTPLHFAAASGDKKTVELLLSKGAQINTKTRLGRTPVLAAMASTAAGHKEVVELLVSKGAKIPALHLAAYVGDMKKVEKCLQDGIDINSQEDFGSTALHVAASGGKKDMVEFLINKGADVNAQAKEDLFSRTPLYCAAIHNFEDIADLLLAKGADVDAKFERWGFPLLYYAIWEENKDAVKLLIGKGASVNGRDTGSGETALHYAIWQGNRDIVELLIAGGADVNAQDKQGYTPLHYATTEGRKQMVELLKAKGATTAQSAIHLAVRARDLAKVKSLIESGTDVNARDEGGQTPLFVAGYDEVAQFLIAHGADVNATDKTGWTPLHHACFNGNRNKVEFLLSKSADINARGETGERPLHLAIVSRRIDVVELLITKGADVNAEGRGGETPLHMARNTEMAKLLLAKGADVNAKGRRGVTPLHTASRLGYSGVVELLIGGGADVNARNDNGQTPLSLAKAQGHEDVVELLKKHGAKE